MARPRYFLVCKRQDIKNIFNGGWIDIMAGARHNNIFIVDRDDREHANNYTALIKKRNETQKYHEMESHSEES